MSFGANACDWNGQRNVMNRKTVILTEIIAPYRIPVFNALAGRAGMDLHVIFLAETDNVLRQWRIYTDEIRFSYEVLPSWRWRAGKHSLLMNRGLWSALDAACPQTILCGGYNYPASWESLWWARRRSVRFVLWTESNERDARSGHAGVEWLKRHFVNSCSAFVVPGKSSFAYLRTLGASEQVIFTAPNAVDNTLLAMQAANTRAQATEFREKLKLSARYILFVGRLVPEKGIFDLLEAYAKLEGDLRSEVALVFAGDGVSREELARQAKRISPGVVCFPGFAQREDLAGLYALAECLVLPTHSDPWGLVVNEAMACGLPIIVTSVAGCAADLVEDGWNGFVAPPRDSEKLSVAINALVRQPGLRQRMSAHSLERIRSYSPEACAEGLAAAAISAGMGAR
jgi:glycosyltransferase involved in cell wall biosynthesis